MTYEHTTFSTVGASIPHVDLTTEEVDIIKLMLNGITSGESPFINPVGEGIENSYRIADEMLDHANELGEKIDTDGDCIPDSGNGVDYSGLTASLMLVKDTLKDGSTGTFREHTRRLSGDELENDNWGELVNIMGLHGVASGYNGVLETIKDEGAPVVDNYSPLFSSILGPGENIISDISLALNGKTADIDPEFNPDGTDGAQDAVDAMADGMSLAHSSMITAMNADNQQYSKAIHTLTRFGVGMSTMSMDRDTFFGKRVIDKVASQTLKDELDDIV